MHKRSKRGIALVTVLLATTLTLAVLAFIVNVGTAGLRRTTQELWEAQTQAGADAAVGWVRALLAERRGDVPAALADMSAVHNSYSLIVDPVTKVDAFVSVHLATAAATNDHVDLALQQNAFVAEAPLQVTVTAALSVDGTVQAARSTTALLRVFRQRAPYSELVGFMDNSGPVGIDSPGDPAGQTGSALATDLRIHVFSVDASGQSVPADAFVNRSWFDGNALPSGPLP
jgi:hypothetical protein